MKTGDLVILAGSTPLNASSVKLRHHLGVIVGERSGVGIAGVSYKAFRVAWTNGERRWTEGSMVKPYAGKNDTLIK
jgi:hypothetical protein